MLPYHSYIPPLVKQITSSPELKHHFYGLYEEPPYSEHFDITYFFHFPNDVRFIKVSLFISKATIVPTVPEWSGKFG